jgi:NAD(P)-dependent dehydrogenase (short-subunit alcohol dehydrogenase family)
MTPNAIDGVRFAGVEFLSLRGRGVIITGGASGIGADLVSAFAGQGCQVGFLDHDQAHGTSLAGATDAVQFVHCDVTDAFSLSRTLMPLET